jgi:hypothetical protein
MHGVWCLTECSECWLDKKAAIIKQAQLKSGTAYVFIPVWITAAPHLSTLPLPVLADTYGLSQ